MRNASVLAFLSLAACGFTPTAGSWNFGSYAVASDTCGEFTGVESESATVSLAIAEDGTLTWDDGVGGVFSCVLEGHEMSCTPVELETSGEDATLTRTLTVAGTFVDEEALNGRLDMTLRCEGSGCEAMDRVTDCAAVLAFMADLIPAE